MPNEWVPDIISSETYIHHTLQRSLKIPQILSPVVTPPPKLMTIGTPPYYLDECGTIDEHQKLLNSNDLIDNSTKSNNIIYSNYYEPYKSLTLKQLGEHKTDYNKYIQQQPYQHYQSATLKNKFANSFDHPSSERYHTINLTDTLKGTTQIFESTSTLSKTSKCSNAKNISIAKENISKNGTLKFGTSIDDEMNDAYYTYTAKKTRTPATTFN